VRTVSASLIARCIEMEHAAWTEFVGSHRPLVLRILVRTVGPAGLASADDLEQEVWSRLLANRCDALRGLVHADPSGIRAFLSRTAMNIALDHRRRMAVRQIVQAGPLDELVDPEEPLEELYARHERRQKILETLEKVLTPPNTDRDRLIFRAHYVDGFSASEIARMGVGLQAKGIETLLLRLVGRVRALLANNEDAA
jgi:RNA polymerase sigma factor (sigma-70 family)